MEEEQAKQQIKVNYKSNPRYIKDMVELFNTYSKKVNEKMKVYRIFSNFENRAREDFRNLLKLSEERYKIVKSGNSSESILNLQRKNYEDIISKILADQLYTTKEYSEQYNKSYAYLSLDEAKNKELRQYRDRVRGFSEANTQKSRYLEKVVPKAEHLPMMKKQTSIKNLSYKSDDYRLDIQDPVTTPKGIKTGILKQITKQGAKSTTPDFLQSLSLNKNKSSSYAFCHLVKNHPYPKNIENDRQTFITDMQNYQTSLDKLKYHIETSPRQELRNEIVREAKFYPDVNCVLNFKEQGLTQKVEVKKDDGLDIKILGRIKRNANNKDDRKSQNRSIPANPTPRTLDINLNSEDYNLSSRREIPTFNDSVDQVDRMGKIKENLEANNKTLNAVRNELLKYLDKDRLMADKRSKIERLLKTEKEIMKPSEIEKKVVRKYMGSKKQTEKSVPVELNETITRDKTDNLSNLRKLNSTQIEKAYERNYDKLKLEWNREDYRVQNEERLEKERKKEKKKFINSVKRNPRFSNIYTDEYSLRDRIVNDSIVEFNQGLGKGVYDKRRLNRKLNEYITRKFYSADNRRNVIMFPESISKDNKVYTFSYSPKRLNRLVNSKEGKTKKSQLFDINKHLANLKNLEQNAWTDDFQLDQDIKDEDSVPFGDKDDSKVVRQLVEESHSDNFNNYEFKRDYESFKKYQSEVILREIAKKKIKEETNRDRISEDKPEIFSRKFRNDSLNILRRNSKSIINAIQKESAFKNRSNVFLPLINTKELPINVSKFGQSALTSNIKRSKIKASSNKLI